jgi:hypothetical protein
MSSRPVVCTFENAADAALFLTVLWNVATCSAPHTELTAHFHSIEWSVKVFYQAAGQFCSEFAPSGLIDAANGLFIAEQRGTVNMIIFFCTTAKIVYCSQHRIITKLCVTFSPYQIHFLKDHIDDHASDLRDVQHSILLALTGKSLASKMAFKSERPNLHLALMFDGVDSNEAKTMSLKPEAAMLFYTLMYYVLAHLAAMKDEVHVRRRRHHQDAGVRRVVHGRVPVHHAPLVLAAELLGLPPARQDAAQGACEALQDRDAYRRGRAARHGCAPALQLLGAPIHL